MLLEVAEGGVPSVAYVFSQKCVDFNRIHNLEKKIKKISFMPQKSIGCMIFLWLVGNPL